MARLVITPTTYINNRLYAASFTALTTECGWYVDISDVDDFTLACLSTHTSAVVVNICAGTSESGTDWILKQKGDLSTSIGSSGLSVLFLDSARFKSTSGIYIDSTYTGSTALKWAAWSKKPKL